MGVTQNTIDKRMATQRRSRSIGRQIENSEILLDSYEELHGNVMLNAPKERQALLNSRLSEVREAHKAYVASLKESLADLNKELLALL